MSTVNRKSYGAHANAWKTFYPEGEGKAKQGYVLHHKDPTLKYRDPERYDEWRPEDLVMMSNSEHSRLHYTEDKRQKMTNASMPKHLGKHHWHKGEDACLAEECPGEGWIRGINWSIPTWNDTENMKFKNKTVDYRSLCGENNTMSGKSSYSGKTADELESIRLKKQKTFSSRPESEKKEINARRGGGVPVMCVTTRRSV